MSWTFGGGTALALRYGHRISYDVDIFLNDVQAVGYLSPRVNEIAASLAESYDESANGIKIVTGHGDIDFLVAADVTQLAPEHGMVQGRNTAIQMPAEILAKKIQYRGYQFTHRDIFDLAVLMERDPGQVTIAIRSCSREAVRQTAQMIAARLLRLSSELADYINPTERFVPLVDRAATIVREFPGVSEASRASPRRRR